MINQLRYVTRKLQGQTLNEAPDSGGKVSLRSREGVSIAAERGKG